MKKILEEHISLRVGILILILILGIAGSVFLYYHNPIEESGLPCMVYKLTGFYCPGCGAGRACYSILHGQFYQAFRYNPLLILLLPWLSLYFALCGIQWAVCGRESVSEHIPVKILYAALFVVLAYGVLRNIPVHPFDLLVPTNLL